MTIALYVIAQFFPRLAVYNDVEGWQNHQFWGNGEFALELRRLRRLRLTVPADHIVDATGRTAESKGSTIYRQEYRRGKSAQAQTSFDKTSHHSELKSEAEEREKTFSKNKKTWEFKAKNVRDFGFASSRKFIWEMMAVKLGGKNVMAVSLYPKEGNPLWEQYSTKAVVQTLKTYSHHTFDYPYPKAVSVHAKNQGMEYPMICWNYGRPDEDGSYSDSVKFGMISVIIHEIGHNFFPMIVNSDERQWGWMDEGLDTFMQYLAEQEFGKTNPTSIEGLEKYPSRRGEPKAIVNYMSGDQSFLAPIMSNPENVYQLGPNAYGKPATALNILRETVMGHDLFDHAFKTYSQRWMFKHPTPADFFRTMEDASAVDLDWFWRGWFYTTDFVDIGVKGIKQFFVSDEPSNEVIEMLKNYGMTRADLPPVVFTMVEDNEEFKSEYKQGSPVDHSQELKSYIDQNSSATNSSIKIPKYFYEISFEKPGGLVMPIIVDYTYSDGSTERVEYPVQVWRKNDDEVKKVVASDKEIVGIKIDPDQETADVDLSNNSWPKTEELSEFNQFKANLKN